MNLTHLHLHSEFSQLDGYGSPNQYTDRAVDLGMGAIALTDHGNIDGAIKWQKACEKRGLSPIIGCELYIVPHMRTKEKGDRRGHITVLVKNQKGYECLLRMLSKGWLDGYYYRPRIGFDTIKEEPIEGLEGLVFMTGCESSFLHLEKGTELFCEMNDWGLHLAIEVMPHNTDSQKSHNDYCIRLSESEKVPLVATADCHYVLAEHAKAQEVLLAIQRKAKWNDSNRWTFQSSHLKSYREMCREFEIQGVLGKRQYLSALSMTNQIAAACSSFRIPKLDIDLPITKYEKKTPHLNADELLWDMCQQGCHRHWGMREVPQEYRDRMNRELDVIERKGFSRYFLIVKEIVDWCKDNHIMVGPGRGSVGGSLVAMLLGITKPQVDPLKYGLLFERFISEDRIDYPDIDLDFENIKCDLVRQHLEEEYGEFNISGISTFLRLKSKSAVRDVGSVFQLNGKDVDDFAKAIKPKEHDEDIILNSGNDLQEGQAFRSKYPDEFNLMVQLEGTIKTSGQHPAGLIVSATNLAEGGRCYLLRRQGKLVCNWDMGDSEFAGLMKIDILKLDTLTVLNEAKRLLSLQGIDLDYDNLALDDPKVFDMMTKGDLEGVFQLSGYACSNLCQKIPVDNIEDMATISALARPGPADSGDTDKYVQRRNGGQWEPLCPEHAAITKDTYGIIVFQEQMMRAMTDLAGFSGNDADRIRKIIGKKRKAEEFEPYRVGFIKGCQTLGTLTPTQAETFWQGLMEWAHYGFVKAHAVEYAIIGYWTAYTKLYHPIEFICAQLTYGAESTKPKMVDEAQKTGLKIVTPKSGVSEAINWIAKNGMLYMPFIEINGIGEKDAEKAVSKRKPIPKKQGFFSLESIGVEEDDYDDALQKLLDQAKAFDPDPNVRPDDCLAYFQYDISGQACHIEQVISVEKKQAMLYRETLECTACKLRKEARQVVPSSKGIYNAWAVAEAPGKEEDKNGYGLCGPAGDEFWDEMKRYGITRRMIHYGNVCKCWPSRTKTPHRGHINTCYSKWLVDEIKSSGSKLVLMMGGSAMFAVKQHPGIVEANGTIEWIPQLDAWVVWCVHPSAVLRNRPYFEPLFKEGIRRFAEEFLKHINWRSTNGQRTRVRR